MFQISFVDNYEIHHEIHSCIKVCKRVVLPEKKIYLGMRPDNEETISQKQSIDVNNLICV